MLGFIESQHAPRREKVVRLADGEAGLTASTIKRRLSSVSGFFTYLVMTGELGANPVPKGIATSRATRAGCPGAVVADPEAVAEDPRARRSYRPFQGVSPFPGPGHGRGHGARRAAALRGARASSCDLRPGEGRVFIADGKGGHQRLVPVSARFFRSVAATSTPNGPRRRDRAAFRGVERAAPGTAAFR